jgi:hypothetical protein
MNDSEELAYAVRFLDVSITEDLKNPGKLKEWQRKDLKASRRWLRSTAVRNVQVYTCSFCENGDLLSQWRGYGVNDGYSIGFSGDVLRQRAEEYGDQFWPVRYRAEEGARLLRVIKLGLAHGVGRSRWGLALIKDPGFQEEHEWRWVCDIEDRRTEECEERSRSRSPNYRAGGLGVIPYLAFSVPKTALRKVVVGPGQHPEVREEGVHYLLDGHGYKGAKVESSSIPIRM